MIAKRVKQSKAVKFSAIFLIFAFIYAVTGFLLIVFAGNVLQFGRALFSTYDILISGALFLFLFVGTTLFISRNENIAKDKILQRGLRYALFFGFSAVALLIILTPAIGYFEYLRFRNGLSSGVWLQTTFYLAIACFITYTIFTALMEMQSNKSKVLRQLIYWFATTVVAGYSSLLVLFFYIGFDYLKRCLPKVGIAEDYCYSIGESIYLWWAPVPGLVVFVIVMLFTILYFGKILRSE